MPRRTAKKAKEKVEEVRGKAREHRKGPRIGLERGHIEELRQSGTTKEEVRAMVDELLGTAAGDAIYSDLDTYGTWASE